MAEFNSVLLGKAFKSVGNLTLVYMKRKNIVKSRVFRRKNTETPEILAQRAKVRVLGSFSRRILPVIRKGFVGVGNGTTSNAFLSLNLENVSLDDRYAGTLDFEHLRVASGLLIPPRVTASYDGETSSYTFTQGEQAEEEGFASLDDQVYGVLLESRLQRVRLVALKERGKPGDTQFGLPDEWDATHVHLYCFATTRNGRMASDSVHLTV